MESGSKRVLFNCYHPEGSQPVEVVLKYEIYSIREKLEGEWTRLAVGDSFQYSSW